MTALLTVLLLAAVPAPGDEFTPPPEVVEVPAPTPPASGAWAASEELRVGSERETNTLRWAGIFTSGLMATAPSIGFGVLGVFGLSKDPGQMLVLAAAFSPLSVVFPLITAGLLGEGSWSDRLKASLLPLGLMVGGAAIVALLTLPLAVMGLAAGGGWNLLPAALLAVVGGAVMIPAGAIAGSALMANALARGIPGTRVKSSPASISFAPIPGGGKVGLTVEL